MKVGQINHFPYDSETRHGVVSIGDDIYYFKGKVKQLETGEAYLDGEVETFYDEPDLDAPFYNKKGERL